MEAQEKKNKATTKGFKLTRHFFGRRKVAFNIISYQKNKKNKMETGSANSSSTPITIPSRPQQPPNPVPPHQRETQQTFHIGSPPLDERHEVLMNTKTPKEEHRRRFFMLHPTSSSIPIPSCQQSFELLHKNVPSNSGQKQNQPFIVGAPPIDERHEILATTDDPVLHRHYFFMKHLLSNNDNKNNNKNPQ